MKTNPMYAIRFDENYLEHHGVKDQKWGVKHGPPYPLDDSPTVQARKKAEAELDEAKTSKAEAEKRSKDYEKTYKQGIKEVEAARKEYAKKKAEGTLKFRDRVKAVGTSIERASLKSKRASLLADVEFVTDDVKKLEEEVKRLKEQEKTEAAQAKAEKLAIIKDGDLTAMYERYSSFTDKEIAECMSRYQIKTQLSSLTETPSEDVAKARSFIEQTVAKGDLNTIVNNPEKFTLQEVEAARQKNETVARAANQEGVNAVVRGKITADKANIAANIVGSIARTANDGIKLYNIAASIHNTLEPNAKEWRKIDLSIPNPNGDKKKDDGNKGQNNQNQNKQQNNQQNNQNKSDNTSKGGDTVSPELASAIRNAIGTMSYKAIAEKYGVSPSTVKWLAEN